MVHPVSPSQKSHIILNIPSSGLGTSTSKEAKEYFAEMERHRITFRYGGAEDDAAITLVSEVETVAVLPFLEKPSGFSRVPI